MYLKLCGFIAFMVLCAGSGSCTKVGKSLYELADWEMGKLFKNKEEKTTAKEMLDSLLKDTTIVEEYVRPLFLEAVREVQKDNKVEEKDFPTIVYDEELAVDVVNHLIEHFQKAPIDAGRPHDEL